MPCQLTKNRVVFDWGVITFERPYESDWGTLEGHFLAPRVAALFADLAPQDGGSSLEQWQSAFFSGGVWGWLILFFLWGGGNDSPFFRDFLRFFFKCFFFTRDFFGFYGRLVESFYLSPSQPKIAAAHQGGVICRLVRWHVCNCWNKEIPKSTVWRCISY